MQYPKLQQLERGDIFIDTLKPNHLWFLVFNKYWLTLCIYLYYYKPIDYYKHACVAERAKEGHSRVDTSLQAPKMLTSNYA